MELPVGLQVTPSGFFLLIDLLCLVCSCLAEISFYHCTQQAAASHWISWASWERFMEFLQQGVWRDSNRWRLADDLDRWGILRRKLNKHVSSLYWNHLHSCMYTCFPPGHTNVQWILGRIPPHYHLILNHCFRMMMRWFVWPSTWL